MSAPDHWATLIVLGRVSKWKRSRLLGVGAVAAVGHVIFSVLLGFLILGLGILVSKQVSLYVTEGTGVVMVVGGLFYGGKQLRSKDKGEDYEAETTSRMANAGKAERPFHYFAVLGAALSPDLSILPIFLLAVPFGLGFALDTAVVFGVASVGALLLFLLLGTFGLAKAFERMPPKYNDSLVGFVIAAVGVYILIVG